MTRLKIPLLISLAALGFASAQSPTLSVWKVTTVKEKDKTVEKLVPADSASPNDTVQYNVKFTNSGNGQLAGVRLHLPVPAAVAFLSQQCTIAGVKAQYSLDAHQYDPKSGAIINVSTKQFGELPLKKTVMVKENGAEVKREVNATSADYTAVRWQLPDLNAKQSVECSLRVKVK